MRQSKRLKAIAEDVSRDMGDDGILTQRALFVAENRLDAQALTTALDAATERLVVAVKAVDELRDDVKWLIENRAEFCQ